MNPSAVARDARGVQVARDARGAHDARDARALDGVEAALSSGDRLVADHPAVVRRGRRQIKEIPQRD